MQYRIQETLEALDDLTGLVAYMSQELKNPQAATRFLDMYDEQVTMLGDLPHAFKGIRFTYQGYEIRMKVFETYHIFFIIDEPNKVVTILRVLKDRQDWKNIIRNTDTYRI